MGFHRWDFNLAGRGGSRLATCSWLKIWHNNGQPPFWGRLPLKTKLPVYIICLLSSKCEQLCTHLLKTTEFTHCCFEMVSQHCSDWPAAHHVDQAG